MIEADATNIVVQDSRFGDADHAVKVGPGFDVELTFERNVVATHGSGIVADDLTEPKIRANIQRPPR